MAAWLLALTIAAPPDSLEAEMRRASSTAGGTVGATAMLLETGERASLEGSERFPMMSVCKFPIALALLWRVERGEVSLDRRVRVGPSDLRLGQSPIADRFPDGGAVLSLEELLEAMLVESDNTACDILLSEAGGAAAVTARLRELGVAGVRVDRSEGELALDYFGVRSAPPPQRWSLSKLRALFAAVPEAERQRAAGAWVADPRDTATPETMANLLARTVRGETLNRAHTAQVLDLMRKTTTGPRRLKGELPAGTLVAHRTGMSATIDGFTGAINDVGVITLPDGRHAVVAVFVKATRRPVEEADAAIASIAKRVWDYWSSPAAR